jgi:hypothetical protein
MVILDKTVSISRLTVTVNDVDKEQYQPVGNMHAVGMNIQPASAELTAVSEGVYGQTYRAFVSVSGIRIGDRVTVSGTNDRFTVKGVQDWYNGILPHLEIVLFKDDN